MQYGRFICHCHVDFYDEGLRAPTSANPTITVTANDEAHARREAQAQLRKQHMNERLRRVTGVRVDLVRKIG